MRPLATGMANATAPEIAPKGVKIVVDGAASRSQGQGKKPARHRAARFLFLLLGIVVFLPVWGLVRHGLLTTYSLPAQQRQKQRDTTSTSHHTHSSRAALELEDQRALNDPRRPSSLASSQGSLSGEIRSDGSGKISNGSLTTASRGSSSADTSSARRSRKQRSPSSSQTRLHLVLSLSTSTDSEIQPATSSLTDAAAAGQEDEQQGQRQVVGTRSGLQSSQVSGIPQAEHQVRLGSIVSLQGENQGTLGVVSTTAGSGLGVLSASATAQIIEDVAGRSLDNRAEQTQPEDQTSSAIDSREIQSEQQVGKPGELVTPPDQQQEQKLGEAQAAEGKGQVQKQDERAQDQKVTPGRIERNPSWSRRMMVLPGSDDYEAADPDQPEVIGSHVAGAASAGMTTRSATRAVDARGVFSSVDVAAREVQAQRRLRAQTGSEGNPLAGKMGRGFDMQARLQGQLLRTAQRGNADSEGNGRGRVSMGDVSIGSQSGSADVDSHRLVIGVTPTYQRAYQVVHITNIVNALRTVQGPFKWIVVEAPYRTEDTQELLQRTAGVCWPEGQPDCRRIDYVHLETGFKERALHNKGVVQRNRALQYVQDQRLDGVVYFMDDDNTYSPRLFRELQKVRNVGVLPVGFLNTEEYAYKNPDHQHRPMVERPLVREGPGGAPEVYGWETYEWSIPTKRGGKERLFCTDMAGFAFSSKLLWSDLPGVPGFPRQPVRFQATEGGISGEHQHGKEEGKGKRLRFLETTFLQQLLPNVSLLEPLASHATEVLVWHTHQEADSAFPYPTKWWLPQPAKARLVPADQEESVWPYIIGGRRHGIKGRSDKWLLPGYQLRDCGPWSLCSIRIKLQESLW